MVLILLLQLPKNQYGEPFAGPIDRFSFQFPLTELFLDLKVLQIALFFFFHVCQMVLMLWYFLHWFFNIQRSIFFHSFLFLFFRLYIGTSLLSRRQIFFYLKKIKQSAEGKRILITLRNILYYRECVHISNRNSCSFHLVHLRILFSTYGIHNLH